MFCLRLTVDIFIALLSKMMSWDKSIWGLLTNLFFYVSSAPPSSSFNFIGVCLYIRVCMCACMLQTY